MDCHVCRLADLEGDEKKAAHEALYFNDNAFQGNTFTNLIFQLSHCCNRRHFYRRFDVDCCPKGWSGKVTDCTAIQVAMLENCIF